VGTDPRNDCSGGSGADENNDVRNRTDRTNSADPPFGCRRPAGTDPRNDRSGGSGSDDNNDASNCTGRTNSTAPRSAAGDVWGQTLGTLAAVEAVHTKTTNPAIAPDAPILLTHRTAVGGVLREDSKQYCDPAQDALATSRKSSNLLVC
jgi:hypothetical protein